MLQQPMNQYQLSMVKPKKMNLLRESLCRILLMLMAMTRYLLKMKATLRRSQILRTMPKMMIRELLNSNNKMMELRMKLRTIKKSRLVQRKKIL